MKNTISLFIGCLLVSPLAVSGPLGEAGVQAFNEGHYPLAITFLELALNKEADSAEEIHINHWRHKLAKAYWETGADKRLLDFTTIHMSKNQAKKWECNVLERRGHNTQAHNCWSDFNDADRAMRTMRSEIMLKSFAGPKTEFGYRPKLQD